MVDIVLAASGVTLLGLAVWGYWLDHTRGREPFLWLHALNLALGMATLAWAACDYLR